MFRLTVLALVLFTSGISDDVLAVENESTKEDFVEYGQAMHGYWLGKITLTSDIEGMTTQRDGLPLIEMARDALFQPGGS